MSDKRDNILASWKAQRGEIQAFGGNVTETGLSAEQLYDKLRGSSLPSPAITEQTAMLISTVYACVNLKAGAFASMPARFYERSNAMRTEVVNHELWYMLNEEANPDITASTLWTYLSSSMDFHGDGFAEIKRPSFTSNKIAGLAPHHPLRVQPFRNSQNQLRYRITPDHGGAQYVLYPEDMIHVPSMGFDGLRSPSPITYAARQNISIALAVEDYNAKFFRNGATSDIALKSPKKLDEEQANLLRASFMARQVNGSNYHVPMVLSGGLELQQLSINPDDAALILTRQVTAEEICRALSVIPDMIGIASGSQVANNLEQKSINFVRWTMQPRMNAVKQELNRKIWPVNPKYFMEFDSSELQMGDFKSRMEGYRIAVGRAGERPIMNVDEVRGREKMRPAPGGDSFEPIGKIPSNPADNSNPEGTDKL